MAGTKYKILLLTRCGCEKLLPETYDYPPYVDKEIIKIPLINKVSGDLDYKERVFRFTGSYNIPFAGTLEMIYVED